MAYNDTIWSAMIKDDQLCWWMSSMAYFAAVLSVLTNFGKICQVWPCMVYSIKYREMWSNMPYKDPVYPVIANYDQL